MRRLLALLGMILGVSMPVLGNFVLYNSLPALERALGPGVVDFRWITNVYLITFTTLLLAGGALGDRFGRRSVFLWGMILFTAASAACGLVETPEQLLGARAVQGVGAALAVPATLSILAATFAGRGRGAVLGLWAAVCASAAVYGPLAGSYIVQLHGWEWLFLVNVPVGAAAFLLGSAARETAVLSLHRRFDLAGIFVGTLGLGFLSFALAEGNFRGWTDRWIAGSLLLAAFFVIVFLFMETRRTFPFVSLRSVGHATFSGSNAVASAVFFAIFGISIFVVAYLQNVLGYDLQTTAARFLPFAATLLLLSPIAGAVSDRLGSRSLMTYGCLLAAGGLGLLLQAGLEPAYESIVVPALVLMGSGMALAAGPMTTAVTGVVDPAQLGGASGATNTARQLGLLLGLSLLGIVVTSAFKNSLLTGLLSAGFQREAAESLVESPSTLSVLSGGSFEALRGQMPAGSAPELQEGAIRAVQTSFLDALHTGALLSIGFLMLAAMISLIFVRSHVISLLRVKAERAPTKQEEAAAVQEPPGEPVASEPSDPSPTPHIPVAGFDSNEGEQASDDPPQATSEPAAQEQQPESLDHPDEQAEVVVLPEPGRAGSTSADLTTVLFQFPFKAGTGSVVENVAGFIRTILQLSDEMGSSAPPAVALPEPIAGGLNASTSADIATLTGYLLLEQRFGRIKPQSRPELAATALVGAARSVKLWNFTEDSTGEPDGFIDDLVKVVMDGIGPAEAPAGGGASGEQAPLSA